MRHFCVVNNKLIRVFWIVHFLLHCFFGLIYRFSY